MPLIWRCNSLAIASTTSFSRWPAEPDAPGSSPPWPASITTTTLRLPLGIGGSFTSGCAGVTGTTGTFATLVAGRLGARSTPWSYRSTTRRLPYCAFGASTKLFGVTGFFRSITTRKSVGVRCAERKLVIGVLAIGTFNAPARVAPLISITRRSGDVRVNTLCCTGPVRSNTKRVLSGARHKRTLFTWVAATALTAMTLSNTPTTLTNARKRIPNPIIICFPVPKRHTKTRHENLGASASANARCYAG